MEKIIRHPWDEWMAHTKQFKLTQGRHFNGQPYAMAVQFRTAAKKRKKTVSILIDGTSLKITVKDIAHA